MSEKIGRYGKRKNVLCQSAVTGFWIDDVDKHYIHFIFAIFVWPAISNSLTILMTTLSISIKLTDI